MSFNTNDSNQFPIIDRTNYEEYFLLYVDDELPAEEKAAVENFAAANPDLKIELHLLLSTKVEAEPVLMNDKQELLSEHMQLQDVDESLLLYIDDELPAAQKEAFEHKIKTNKELQLQYELLQKTKLDKEEVIIFPNKKDLYHTTKRVAYLWLRVAAAIIIITGAALLFWLQPVTTVSTPTVVQHTTPTVEPSHPSTTSNNVIQQKEEATSIAMEKEPVKKEPEETKKAVTIVHETKNETASVTHEAKDTNTQDKVLTVLNDINRREEPVAVTPIPAPVKSSPPIIHKFPVTSDTPETYTITNASFNTKNTGEEVAENSGDNKVHLKGFLRKATRFIERTTNIHPADEDQELLIGAVAISLK